MQTCRPARATVGQPSVPRRSYHVAKCSSDSTREPKLARRDFLLASLCSLATAVVYAPTGADAAVQASASSQQVLASTSTVSSPELQATSTTAASAASESAATPIYFGNGCYWGRQYDFVNTEKALGRSAEQISSVVGYAGGRRQSPDGRVCYYRADELTVYEQLGHAEVVQVELHGKGQAAQQQFRIFADTYFSQFQKTPFGMMRLDPQDAGPGYRNVIGLPEGINSPLMKILQEANVNGMKLVAGQGNEFQRGKPLEGDTFNTVYILDSTQLPFFRAEQYHQFHNGIGKAFPQEYTQGLKQIAMKQGRINPTGCPEYSFAK